MQIRTTAAPPMVPQALRYDVSGSSNGRLVWASPQHDGGAHITSFEVHIASAHVAEEGPSREGAALASPSEEDLVVVHLVCLACARFGAVQPLWRYVCSCGQVMWTGLEQTQCGHRLCRMHGDTGRRSTGMISSTCQRRPVRISVCGHATAWEPPRGHRHCTCCRRRHACRQQRRQRSSRRRPHRFPSPGPLSLVQPATRCTTEHCWTRRRRSLAHRRARQYSG